MGKKINMNDNSSTQKYILNYQELKIGDIILESGKKIHSKMIQNHTKSHYSHAMICVDHNSIIHATLKGVFSLNPQRKLVDNIDEFKVLRLENKINKNQVQKIENFLRLQIGISYSKSDALYVALSNKEKKANNKQFCSRLVAQAYNNIGIKLVEDIDFCSPADIENSTLLYEVKKMVRECSQADINQANTKNMIEENQESFFCWLNKTKKLAKKYNYEILNDNDVPEFICKYSTEDNIVCEYIEKSGYLENWKIEVINNPQMHDKYLFENMYKVDLLNALINQYNIVFSPTQRYIKDYVLSNKII
jgi:uncharacterized protein YycO